MGIQRLQHASIPIPPGRRDDAVRFYTEVMGLAEIRTPPALDRSRIIWFSVGNDGDELHLFTEENARSATSGQHVCLVVDDLEAMRSTLVAEGIEIGQEPDIAFRPRFSFRDPFGNKIEISEIHGNFLDVEE